MSRKVFGIIDLKDFNFPNVEQRIQKEIELTFAITAYATQNKIGIKLGGNVSSCFDDIVRNLTEKIYFELTDDPMDINAESLFIGDGIKLYIKEVRVDIGESLLSRMSRMQSFLNELLKNKYINKITLDINALDINEEDVEIINVPVNNFCKKMLELYKRENNWTPTVRIIVNKL